MRVRKLILFQLILFCVLFSGYIPVISKLSIAPEIPTAFAVEICPEVESKSLSPSDIAPNPGELKEQDDKKVACSKEGFINKVRCIFAKLFANFSGQAKLNLRNSQMPEYLRRANELALSGDPESDKPGELTGSIAKLLPPGYEQNELDPLVKLTEAEGQMVSGTITLNQNAPQKRFTEEEIWEHPAAENKGYYDFEEEGSKNYQVEGRFGEIAPLYDRFGLLKQALLPSADEVNIPDLDDSCSAAKYDPSLIVVTGFPEANPDRDVPWSAYQQLTEDDDKELGCREDEEGNVVCPGETTSTFEVGGDLDVQTEVSLASKTWERIGAPSSTPGEGGVLSILLPPDTYFRTEDIKDSTIPYTYDPHSEKPTYSEESNLYIADLGNVEGAVSCIVDQLTAHPASAQYGACKAAFDHFAGIPIECTDEATPLDFANTANSSIARRAWEIVNNLYQGFWCYWNRSPDYPELFNEEKFRANPHPTREEMQEFGQDLFWCTQLLYKSGLSLNGSLRSDKIAQNLGDRFIDASKATHNNIKPGYIVFVSSRGGPKQRRFKGINHVGIVYEVAEDYIKFIQSNAATKPDVITIGKKGIQDLPWATVSGFGRP